MQLGVYKDLRRPLAIPSSSPSSIFSNYGDSPVVPLESLLDAPSKERVCIIIDDSETERDTESKLWDTSVDM